MIFQNREEAGQKLASKLENYRAQDVIVLGAARGGVVVAAEIAKILHLPLDVLIIRKIGAPGQPELALGAVASAGSPVYNEDLLAAFALSKESLKEEVKRQRQIIEKRMRIYYANRKPLGVTGKTLLIVDDGMATGATMKVAVQILKNTQASTLVVAVPVASEEALQEIKSQVPEVVCLYSPHHFEAVGAFYRSFEEVTDEDVLKILEQF